MLTREIIELYELIDRPGRVASAVEKLFKDLDIQVTISEVKGDQGVTDFIKIALSGRKGKSKKGSAPTLGIIGRLGGVGARPDVIGMVSDGDGALTALSVALRIARMQANEDIFEGDVIVGTHLCTEAPTVPHDPVPFMGSPVDLDTMNHYEVDADMDAIMSIDTSRGNRIINRNGFAISPTVKEGWILRVSEDLLDVMQWVTGKMPAVVPITMQDITPYGNGLYHFNSLMLPSIATTAPVVGVAITSEMPVPGCWTGVSNVSQIDEVGRFVIEVAQGFTKGKISLYDETEFAKIKKIYGSMSALQTKK